MDLPLASDSSLKQICEVFGPLLCPYYFLPETASRQMYMAAIMSLRFILVRKKDSNNTRGLSIKIIFSGQPFSRNKAENNNINASSVSTYK